MKTLNLTDLSKSDIKYKINNYPDGQKNITIEPFQTTFGLAHLTISVTIKSRMNNMEDVGLIVCATQSLKLLGVKDIHLYVPYFLGSRSDRQFEEGSNNYLKHVICPIINLQGYSSVAVLDPHSHVLEACLNGFKKVSNEQLVKYAIMNSSINPHNMILVSPDAGASHKIYKLAEQIGYKGDIITCSKERDENGKLTKCVVPKLKNDKKDYILIDDIGDRFGTFKNIAREIKKDNNFCGKLYLIVTHSIQDEGIIEALKYFDQIYTTNSFKDRNIENCKVLNIF